MIRALFIFLILLASVWLGVQLKGDPGYLLIAYHHWTIETTLWVAIIFCILAFCLFHSILLLMHWIVRLPLTWSHWLTKRRGQIAQAKTRQGLIEFSEGHWQEAKNHLIKALPDTDTPLLNYLTAARAAQEMGDNKLRDDYLREAQQSMPEAKIAVELTQAQLQLANRQWEQALATLRHLQDLAPHHPYVLKLLMHLYEEVKDWSQLIELLPALKRNHVITEDKFEQVQKQAYLQYMLDLIKQNQSLTLEKLVNALPKPLVYDPDLMSAYSHYLLHQKEDVKAEALLRRCLRKQFSEPLIVVYGLIKANDSQLSFAETLLKEHPHSAPLFLCLGRLCMFQQLWGKAKTYFEKSIEFSATPTAYLELGKLLDQLNEPSEASHAFQSGLCLAERTTNICCWDEEESLL